MGKIALSENLSLDGVMQSPGPTDVPFRYRGWAVDYSGGPDGFDFEREVGLEQAQHAGAVLLGRTTFEAMNAFWPTAQGRLADRLNELPKYVVSSTLTEPAWDATVLGEDWPQQVARLREEVDGDVLVYGSRRLARSLIELGLVDELRLIVYPLVLGVGDRLFEDVQHKLPLRLVESRPLRAGVVHLTYAPDKADR